MNTNLLSPKLKGLLAILGLLLSILIVVNIVHLFEFRVTGTDPSVGYFSNAVPFFKINFNRQISTSGLELTSSPNIINSYKVEGNMLYINLKPLTIGSSYTIDIKNIEDTKQHKLSRAFTFTAQNIDSSNLPADQKAAILKNQSSYGGVYKDPIIAHLPYQTLNYSLNSQIEKNSSGQPYLIVSAEIFLSEADMSNENAAINKDKQDISNYISSLGLNPSSYNIQYSISTP